MNRRFILLDLKEAKEELDRAIQDIENDPGYDIGEYLVAMGHLYHHLNTAWNGRDGSDEEHRSAVHFNKWRRFPENSELLLDTSVEDENG